MIRRMLAAAIVTALMILAPVGTAIAAVGNVVGTGCLFTWNAVTTNTDGTPITGTVTYNVYLTASATQPVSPPATPTVTGLTGTVTAGVVTVNGLCKTLASGQWWTWVSAVENFAGSTSESALSPIVGFIVAVPGTPGGVGVK